MNHNLTHSFLTLSIANLLLACGGGGDDSAAPPVTPNLGQLSALNGLSTSRINTQTKIDLAPFILGKETNTKISIKPPADLNCPTPLLDKLKFAITPTEAGWCDYVYQVYNDQGVQDEAVMTVVVSSTANPMLPKISITAKVNEKGSNNKIAIDLITNVNLEGYALIKEKVSVQAPDGMALGEISLSENTINYQPPTDHGWNYIQYALFNPVTESTRIGYVFITLSDSVNAAPDINPILWQYPDKIKPGVPLLVELDKLKDKGLSICGEEAADKSCYPNYWQLVGVSAMGANVTPANAELLGNKAFEFISAVEGNYSVNYIVGDYDGGFTHGAMGILVDGNEDIKGWTDITVKPSYKYSAPLLGVDVPSDVNWSQNTVKEIINNKHYEIALWEPAQADAYCDSMNLRLPTASEMIMLNQSTEQSIITERNKWPVSKGYFVKDGEQYGAITLQADNTHVNDVNEKTSRYATCLSAPAISACFNDSDFKQVKSGNVLYLSSPPQKMLDCLNFSYNSVIKEQDTPSVKGVYFGLFNHSNAEKWCSFLSENQYEGRSNWALSTKNTLQNLDDKFYFQGSSVGWPTSEYYWSSSVNYSKYWARKFSRNHSTTFYPSEKLYVSCASR